MMTPLDDFVYLINQVLLGEEPVCNNLKQQFEYNFYCFQHFLIYL